MFFVFLAIPREVGAGFLDSILNTEAYAENSSLNSQTMTLLKPNVSPADLLASKENKKKDDKKDAEKNTPIDQKSNIKIVANNSLLPTATPQSTLSEATGGGDFSSEENDIEIYVVKAGDTAQIVADMFDISVDTIYSANDMQKGEKLKVGDVLLILPFSGIEHTIVKGETTQSIATKYNVDLKDILSANDLDASDKLSIGEKLMVPGAHILTEATPQPKPKTGASGIATKKGGVSSSLPSVSGYFINPVPGARRTRGLQSGHRGVDLAAPTGTPIHAAATGTAIIARKGYNGGFGTYVIIQHDNGTKTLYAHMSELGTAPGAKVSQGEVIGYVGNTGDSRGNHLHIEVLGGKNPF